MIGATYTVFEDKIEGEILYYFISEGNSKLIKAIQYLYVADIKDHKVYNFAFGDYDQKNEEINDSVNTDNGDVYKVFNTVLSTVPLFFESMPDAMLIVQGSDSTAEFSYKCRMTCVRRCDDKCKKSHRRIHIYSGYVNKNFDELGKEFTFYGGINGTDNKIVTKEYVPGEKYDAVLVLKK